jgi:integrase
MVMGTANRYGEWKEYPKTSASRDEVPIAPHVVKLLQPLVRLRPQEERVFLSVRGRPLHMENWRRTWDRALGRANEAIARHNATASDREHVRPIDPEMDPHDCRHTAASWLAQAGVPLYDIKGLMRHESIKTTEKYAHLQPGAHGAVEAAWGTLVTHQRRTAYEDQARDYL